MDRTPVESAYQDAIAVVGMSCRFPGANNTAEYWKLLSEGREAIRKIPNDRPFYGTPEAKEMQAGFLNCPIDEFDAKFFGISPREAALVDPQQRLLLEVTWECLEHAGINPQTLRDSDTGVYVGLWQQDYERIILESKREEDDKGTTDFLHVFLGNKYSATASRISFCLGLHGPAVAVESGCSSSLTGLHLACESLRHGETSLALVSGANLVLLPFDPFSGKSTEEKGIVLSRDYRCKTFDESADGFVRAEACGVVALKRLEDARKDGDNILALIRGSAVNNDGTGTSFGTPNEKAQERVYRSALKRARVAPSDVSFVETHGTGTAVGDPIEMYAVGQVYSEGRTEPLLIGSVKTNIGHCEAGAGIASLIKVILCLQNEAIPPHLNLKNLNPRINLDSIPARIPMELTPWKAPIKIAAVSSFSMSATNAHVIVQEAPKMTRTITDLCSLYEFIGISAKSEEALMALIQKYVEFLKQNGDLPLKEIAYSANIGRAHLQHRIAVVAADTTQLLARLEKKNFTQGRIPALKPKLGFLFTGQGSQYFGMTKGLCETFPVFQAAMDQCDDLFRFHLDRSLLQVLYNDESLLNLTLYCQPAIFCIEYCLTQVWKFFGVIPDCVLGHSVGEFAAAVCSGILRIEDAMKLLATRSILVNNLPEGCMLAIRTSQEQTKKLISTFTAEYHNEGAWIDIAAINSAEEVVVSCKSGCLRLLEAFCSNSGVKYTRIPATHAFHSRDMDSILAEFGKIAETIPAATPNCTYVSGTLAKSMEAMEFGSQYWQRHLRDTVRFSDAVQVMMAECKILLEIGPQPTLLSLAMANMADSNGEVVFCPSQRRNEEAPASFLSAMKKLYVSGIDFSWESVYGVRQKYVNLPMYAFQRQKYWVVDETEREDELNQIVHPLLGKQFSSPLSETIFCQTMRLKELSYLEDHKVLDYVVMPGAAMLEAFLAAGREVLQGGSRNKSRITIENFAIRAAMPIEKKCSVQTMIALEKDVAETASLKYNLTFSRKQEKHFDKWKKQATAEFTPSPVSLEDCRLDLVKLKSSLNHKESLASTYKTIADLGIQFGPQFQSIGSVWFGPRDVITEIQLPKAHEKYVCHPVVLDAMIQTAAFREHLSGQQEGKKTLSLPVSIRRFTWCSETPSSTVFAYIGEETGTVRLFNVTGELLAVMEGLELIPTTANSVLRAIREESQETPPFMHDKWQNTLGKMDSRVNISKITAITAESPRVKEAGARYEGASKEDSLEYSEKLRSNAFHSFCKGIQECEWVWPEVGKVLYAEQWQALLPKSLDKRLVFVYLYELEIQGYLAEISTGEYKVLKTLPIQSESDSVIAANKKRILERSGNVNTEVDLNFLQRFTNCFPLILQEKMTPLAYLFPEDESEHGAAYMYTQSTSYNYQNCQVVAYLEDFVAAFQNTASKDGILRILEVGAGTASTTLRCVETLKTLKIPYHYTFTDISPYFLNEAKKKLGTGGEMSYELFNVEKDPLVQGFCPEQFDVVIGVNVLHATIDLENSLANLKTVLTTDGCLIIGEAFIAHPLHTFTYGMLEGWWRFQDFRLTSKTTALLDAQQWEKCLERCGFNGVSSLSGVMFGTVAGRKVSSQNEIIKKAVNASLYKKWLLIQDSSPTSTEIALRLANHNRDVLVNNIFDPDMAEYVKKTFDIKNEENIFEGIICFCTEFESCNIIDIQQNITQTVLPILQNIEVLSENFKSRSKIIVVTRGVYHIGDSLPGNPNGATAWGMLKVFRNENPNAKICLIDLDPEETEHEVSQVFAQLWNQKDELFVAFRKNKSFVQRLIQTEKSAPEIQIPNSDSYKFLNPESGAFGDIDIGPVLRVKPKENEVEVEIRACALNFRDLFMVMKPEGFSLPDMKTLGSMDSVGLDISGVVLRVGSAVTRIKAGDKVCGIAHTGGLGTHTVVDEQSLIKIPPKVRYEEAATIPCAFMTAILGLIEIGKVTASDRVLIHVASGGVGLAAIQILKIIGAEIYATAGNKRKRAYLRGLGIKYVYHSRDTSYAEGIERDTKGAGISVVLNSLTAPGFKEATLRVCCQEARFIEIAKMNIWQPKEVTELRPDVKYSILDLSLKDALKDAESERKLKSEEQFAELEKMVADGRYSGLPCVTFPLCKVRQAFSYFQQAKHIGKIVVQIPKRIMSDSGKIEHIHTIFNSKSSYMITGGLGGIGVEVTKWMLSKGARTIVLVGRNPPSEFLQSLIEKWNSQGSNVIIMQSDIGQYENCQRLLDSIKILDLPPLRGIMHAAGIIADASVVKQTCERFESVLKPKVYGGWYLHTLTRDYQMEFFIMFSSLSGILGMMGQANHAAANRYLDSLASYRVSMGLPATTINWGGWCDVGAAARLGLTAEVFSGMRMFSPSQGIAALEKIMTSIHTQAAVSEVVDWNIVKSVFHQGCYMDEMKSGIQDTRKFDQYDHLIDQIKKATSREDRQIKVQTYIEAVLKETLSLPATEVLDIDQNFADLGVDSLMGMEMKNRFQSVLEHRTLSISAVQENRTIRSLSAHIAHLMDNEPLDTRTIPELILEDVILPEDITAAGLLPAVMPSEFKNVLLTGATGHLGIYCLEQLLNVPHLKVCCLIRGNSDADATEKLEKALKRYKIELKHSENIQVLVGDMSQENLGLSSEAYVDLSKQVDAIMHFAAKVNHVDKYSDGSRHDMRTHNVAGTVNILKLSSCFRLKSVFFASTLFCCSELMKSGVLVEEYPSKDNMGEGINWGYLLSKFICEKLVGEATLRGIPVTTVRFPVIFGSSVTGYMPTGYNHVWASILASIRVRMIPQGRLNGIPIIAVDSAAKVATELFLKNSAENGVYNLTVGSSLNEEIIANGLEEYGVACEFVPFKEWRDAVFEEHDAEIMGPLKSLYQDDNQESGIYSLHTLSKETDNVNISTFSSKMIKNLPEASEYVASPELVVRCQLRAHFNSANKDK